MEKVQSNQSADFGKTLNFGGHELTFDKFGVALVKDKKTAEELAERYEGWLFAGVAPKVTVSLDPTLDKLLSEELVKAQTEIEKLKDTVSAREGTISSLETEVTDWKEQVGLFQEKAEKAEFDLSEHKSTFEKNLHDLQLENSLLKKTKAELVEFAISLEIPDDKYDGLNKDELISLILTESATQ